MDGGCCCGVVVVVVEGSWIDIELVVGVNVDGKRTGVLVEALLVLLLALLLVVDETCSTADWAVDNCCGDVNVGLMLMVDVVDNCVVKLVTSTRSIAWLLLLTSTATVSMLVALVAVVVIVVDR